MQKVQKALSPIDVPLMNFVNNTRSLARAMIRGFNGTYASIAGTEATAPPNAINDLINNNWGIIALISSGRFVPYSGNIFVWLAGD